MNDKIPLILIRGGGDLATGVALRLYRAGFNILITEHPQPLAVRRLVSFAEAVYSGVFSVEGITARLVQSLADVSNVLGRQEIPVYIDPGCQEVLKPSSYLSSPQVIIDARMTKQLPDLGMDAASLVIGLGPGFNAGENCHAAIETNRGHFLGRVIWDGSPQADTGIPGAVENYQNNRVIRSPQDGVFSSRVKIGNRVQAGQVIAVVGKQPIIAPFDGVLRGLLYDGLQVQRGLKVGDIDPRGDSSFARLVSDKSLAIGGGVLEALLTRPEIRESLWN